MKAILHYTKEYIINTNKLLLILVTLMCGTFIFLNYHYDLDRQIRNNFFFVKLIGWYAVFAIAFILPWLTCIILDKREYYQQPRFLALLFIAPLIFAIKISIDIQLPVSGEKDWNLYWNHVIYWPLLVLIIGSILFIVWKSFDKDQPFYGMRVRGIGWQPYFVMLLIMVPLIGVASTQHDFLAMYPKLGSVKGFPDPGELSVAHKILYELSYGTDFISIELFFRGFLILAFIKWAGKDAILPMACFYCTIHFGKPLGECISSYFGGILLGIIVSNTRSILGGLIVHLGIAWLMELGGYLGSAWK